MGFSSILQKAKDLVRTGQEGVSSTEIKKAMEAKEDLIEKINTTTIPSSYVYYYYMLLEKLEFLKTYKSDEDTEKDISRELSDYKINKINNQEAFIDRYIREYGYDVLRERRFEFDSFHQKAMAYLDKKLEQYEKEQTEKAIQEKLKKVQQIANNTVNPEEAQVSAEERAKELERIREEERAKVLERVREEEKARSEAMEKALAEAREAERLREETRAKELERLREEAKAREEERAREIERIREEARIREEERVKALEAEKAARLAEEEALRKAEEARQAELAAKLEAAARAGVESNASDAIERPAEKKQEETAAASTGAVESLLTGMLNKREDYQYPSPELLKSYPRENNENTLNAMAETIRKLYASFGTEVNIAAVHDGPSMVRFDLKLGSGVSVYNVIDRKDDIQMALAAQNVDTKIIPGTSYIGVFVSKDRRDTIGLRELMESDRRAYSNPETLIPVGMDVTRSCVYCDLKETPHLLIAGATGSGKTALINSIIMSILYRTRPSKLKLLLIDAKGFELTQYDGMPHMLIPAVTDARKAVEAIKWAISEAKDRLKKFEDCRVKDINSYNQQMDRSDNSTAKLQRIVVIIDELAMVMSSNQKEAEAALTELASLGRAAGVHLIIGVQKPVAEIVTPAIKNNMPAKVALRVASRWDSKTILDQFGAENLLGDGDMLYSVRGSSDILHLQGAYVTDGEINSVVNFLNY